jgi:hypothetical protein
MRRAKKHDRERSFEELEEGHKALWLTVLMLNTMSANLVELLLTARKTGDKPVEAECIRSIRGENGAKPEYRTAITRAFMHIKADEVRDFALYTQQHRLFTDREIFICLSVRGKMRPAECELMESIVQEIWGDVTVSRIILTRLIDARLDANAAK